MLVERLEGGKRRNQGGLGAWQETDVCFVWPIPFAFLTAAQVFLLMYFYCFLPPPRPLYAFSCLFCLCLLAVSLLSVYKYKRLYINIKDYNLPWFIQFIFLNPNCSLAERALCNFIDSRM